MRAAASLFIAAMAAIGLRNDAAAPDVALEQEYRELLKERDALSRNTRILRDEVTLSKTKRPYLVADLGLKQLTLKVHGLAVKRIAAVEVHGFARTRCVSGIAVLEKFAAPRAPGAPAPDATGTVKNVAVTDVPQAYRLGFVAGDRFVELAIRPAPATAAGKAWLGISGALSSGAWAVWQAFGSRTASYRLVLAPEDAQALFWALEKGSSAILVCD